MSVNNNKITQNLFIDIKLYIYRILTLYPSIISILLILLYKLINNENIDVLCDSLNDNEDNNNENTSYLKTGVLAVLVGIFIIGMIIVCLKGSGGKPDIEGDSTVSLNVDLQDTSKFNKNVIDMSVNQGVSNSSEISVVQAEMPKPINESMLEEKMSVTEGVMDSKFEKIAGLLSGKTDSKEVLFQIQEELRQINKK